MHARTPLPPFLSLILLLPALADGRQKPPADLPAAEPLRQVLGKKGYVAVPLIQEAAGGGFRIECKSGSETWRMALDSGAEYSSLDLGLVKKLGLKHEGEVTQVGIEGNQKGVKVSLRGLTVGEFDTRAVANVIGFRASDFSARNRFRDQNKQQRTGGLLGHAALDSSAAVIDYPARTLYLRTPLDGLWPEVEGGWVAVSGQDDGQDRVIDPNAPPTLEFKDRRFHLTDGAKRYVYGLHVQPDQKGRYKLAFFAPEQEFAEELNYRAGGLLEVAGDKLTVCLYLDLSKVKGLPEDFTAPAGSGRLLLEFRRAKPRPGRPAGPADPVRAILKTKGYVAVPLAHEDGGGFTIECKSGTETLRLLLDTGAEASALDMGLVKKLGLTPKRKFTVIGTGGTRDGVEVSLRGLTIGDFDTRSTFNKHPVLGIDFSAMNAAMAQYRKLKPIDGCLGHSTLSFYAAVIDYSTRTLYLRKPLDGLWPRIEGKWVATSVEDDGQQRVIDPSTPPRLEFKDRLFRLTYGGRQYMYGLHVKPEGKGRYTLALFDPVREFATTLGYKAGGLLKVEGDQLTVCLLLNPTKTRDKMPTDFTAPAGSGHVLLEFRREK